MDVGHVEVAIAYAALDGEWAAGGIALRIAAALGEPPRSWMRALAKYLAKLPRPDADEAAQHIGGHLSSAKARARARVRRWFTPQRTMRPSRFAAPPITNVRELADLLEVPIDHVEWLADARRMNVRARDAKLRHYSYRIVPKRTGGVRLIEAPKPALKAAQRRLLDRVLVHCPPHPSAMGFASGRSVRDHAAAHAGRRVVVRLDLENFFWQIVAARVRGIFRALGYPFPVDHFLTGIATTVTPIAVRMDAARAMGDAAGRYALRSLLSGRHLPQGAPSSPALANLCAFGLDRRLSGLAARFGATYTRYADDLAFSGGDALERAVERFLPRAAAICELEGFRVRHHKTRVMRSGGRQELCGVVVNRRPSMRRTEIERLEATLYNSIRSGPAAQNREGHPDFRAHLRGRIEWLAHLHPARGERMKALFDRIAW